MRTSQFPYFYKDVCYRAIRPQADTCELADEGRRILLYHDKKDGPILRVAEKGVLTAGWVVGVERA